MNTVLKLYKNADEEYFLYVESTFNGVVNFESSTVNPQPNTNGLYEVEVIFHEIIQKGPNSEVTTRPTAVVNLNNSGIPYDREGVRFDISILLSPSMLKTSKGGVLAQDDAENVSRPIV